MIQNLNSLTASGIKNLIERHGLTRQQFAEKCFVDERTVRRWLQNGIDSIDTISKVYAFFDEDFRTLFT